MFTSPPRNLPYPLTRSAQIETENPAGEEPCGVPAFPEDSDEKITVSFRLSLNEFVALASAIDVGSDIAFGRDGGKVWWIWIASVMCASFCEEIASCFENENESLMIAVANAIKNNLLLQQAIGDAIEQVGGATPGLPLSELSSGSNTLPDNVYDEEGDCVLDNLWGGVLYLVQTANRAISDFFEIIESAGNTLETATIVAEAIPAAGDYVAAAGAFADQLQENISEGYAAAYTEEYEEELACEIFCIARENCSLSIDELIEILNQRLPDPGDFSDFGLVMARIGSGTYSGPEIADVAFYLYFTALRFGQQFGSTLGIRPLEDMMSLGADFLSSDNWELLCDCPTECTPSFRIVNPIGFSGGSIDLEDNMDGTWTLVGTAAFDTSAYRLAFVEDDPSCCWNTLSVSFTHTPENLESQYNCGAEPTDSDYANGIGTGSLSIGLCASGFIGSDVNDAFQLTWVFEACP